MGAEKEQQVERAESKPLMGFFDLDYDMLKTSESEPKKETEEGDEPEEKTDEIEESVEESTEEQSLEEGDGTQEDSEESQEEDSPEEDNEYESLIQDLIDSDLLDFDEEKEYSMDKEGLQSLLKETVEKKTSSAIETFKNSFEDEKTKDLIDVLSKGGTIEDWQSSQMEIDYMEIPVEGNEHNQMLLVKDLLGRQDYSEEEIEKTLTSFAEKGILQEQAEIAKKKLDVIEKKRVEDTKAKFEEEREKQIELEDKAAEEFKETVLNAEKFKGVPVKNKEEAAKLYDFIVKPVNKEGKTQFQLMDDDESRMAYALLLMKNEFDPSKIETKIKTKTANNLKKKLSNHTDRNAKPKQDAAFKEKETSYVSPDKFDFDTLLI